MHFIVEVGNSEQRELILNELKLIFGAATEYDQNLGIYQVIVPVDFDSTINALLGTSSYRSVRNLGQHDIVAQAKVINTPNGLCVVISPRIFNEQQDIQTRCFIYVHELGHVKNRDEHQSKEALSQSDSIYAHNLETFFDEYVADRAAYALIDRVFPSKSHYWKAEIARQASQFSLLLTSSAPLDSIKSAIKQLQDHQDIARFLNEVHPIFDGICLTLAHSVSLSDHYPTLLPTSELAKSKFVNARTFALIDYARQQYNDGSRQLANGLPLIKDFMRNLGIAFSDSPQGLVCHVDYSDF